ncbi:MAG: phospho-N-acetylmuramoyl-pentapeptide-transferase [Phycisphaerae bacterium]
MIYWLLGGKGLLLRITGAGALSFLLVVVLGPKLIRFLMKKKLGDRPEFDHADLNELTRHKSNTPTMGGVLIVVAILLSVLLFADVYNMYIRMALLAAVWLGILGGCDDWIKLRYAAGEGSRDGLKSWQKLLFQVGLAALLSLFMHHYGSESYVWVEGKAVNPAHGFYLPFLVDPIALSKILYVILAILVMTGSSNAVNLTDGMDGLATGCLMIVASTFLLLSWIVGVREWAMFFHMPLVAGAAEMTVICAAMIGACMGFLWYNAPPAQVFMGDTGSLPLGGLLGYIAVVTRQEVLLVVAGGIFVAEAVSVMLQVGYYKLTKRPGGIEGRRIFRCAPLHHHFHLGGWAESKVVVRFWLVTIMLCALALAMLKMK